MILPSLHLNLLILTIVFWHSTRDSNHNFFYSNTVPTSWRFQNISFWWTCKAKFLNTKFSESTHCQQQLNLYFSCSNMLSLRVPESWEIMSCDTEQNESFVSRLFVWYTWSWRPSLIKRSATVFITNQIKKVSIQAYQNTAWEIRKTMMKGRLKKIWSLNRLSWFPLMTLF